MTDPKSISQHREHYTEQYGVEPLNRNYGTEGAYESELGDTVDIDGNEVLSSIPDAYQEFFTENLAETPSDVLEDLSDQDIHSAMGTGEGPIEWDEASQVQNQITELIAKLKEGRSEGILGEEAAAEFLARANEALNQLKGADSLPPEAVEGLIEAGQGVLDEAGAAFEEGEAEYRDRVASADNAAKSLLEKIEDSDLSDAQQEELSERVESFREDLEGIKAGRGVFGEEQTEALEELQEDISRAIGTETLIESFEDLPAKIPNKGAAPHVTTELTRQVRDAMQSGDWTQVRALLDELRGAGETNIGFGMTLAGHMNDIIQQFVGAIYFGIAGEDEKKLDQFLSLIPREIRQTMADMSLMDEGERMHMGGCGTDAERREHYFYGNPTITADRLLDDDIEDAGEDIGRSAGAETGSED